MEYRKFSEVINKYAFELHEEYCIFSSTISYTHCDAWRDKYNHIYGKMKDELGIKYWNELPDMTVKTTLGDVLEIKGGDLTTNGWG